jgi:hypothetical protein
MNEKPILFSGAMVRAIMEGRKTVTRRPHGLDELNLNMPDIYRLEGVGKKSGTAEFSHGEEFEHRFDVRCPFGEVGDRLWVRESYQVSKKYDDVPPRDIPWDRGVSTYFAAGGSRAHDDTGAYVNEDTICFPDWVGKMRPSIHMPRLACRTVLEVVSVKVERLQDISNEQAEAEGVDFLRAAPDCDETLTAAQLFDCLWSSINGDESWAANPWVWVVEFKVVA